MLARFRVPLSWSEILKRTVKEAVADDVPSLAAQQAYYFFFALFPALLALIAFASFFPVENLVDEAVSLLERVAPRDVVEIILGQITKISESRSGGILTVAFLFTLWSSSNAMLSMVTTLNTAYDIQESRPWWKTRLVAIGLTVGLALFILLSMTLILLGPTIAERTADTFGLGAVVEWTWKILMWPVVFLLVSTAIALVYYFAPDAEQDWEWITPGAVISTILWLLASLAFKVYLANFADYNATYGSLGGVIVLMLWFYISAIAILVGAEMNAEIEHASPHGKEPGEKVPGQRKKLGAAAAREHEERQRRLRGDAGGQPRATTPPRPVAPAPAFRSGSGSGFMPGALVFLIVRWFRRERS